MTSPDDTTGTPSAEERDTTPDSGLRDTTRLDTPEEAPPEQSPGGEEVRPDGVAPKAGYPKLDPRHEDKPYQP